MASRILLTKPSAVARLTRSFSTSPRQHAAEVKRLGVIGAGQMVSAAAQSHAGKRLRFLTYDATQGLGIALVAAQKAQVPVHLIDTSEKALDKGMAFAGLC
jgi:3-hydroxybutyryl-CoA dehydrogenase